MSSVCAVRCGKVGCVLESLRRMLRQRSDRAEMLRRAGVYAKPGVLLIHSTRTTTAGVGLAGPEVHRLVAPFSPEAVGAAARLALAAYRHDVPHPKDWSGVGREFLSACGVRSWKALEKDARFCGIESSPDRGLRLSSTRNGGSAGDEKGFQPNDVPDRVLAQNVGDRELGEAILAAIEDCT